MLRLMARAKINWSLDILGTRNDGYHRMDMLMESVSLADELTI
jgi:4-diphosphocytidyl-2-C-methyl-D-erythritol kinase